MRTKMVDNNRKAADEAATVENCVTATGNPSLKLRINLRERQPIRKRQRSLSPASDSSSLSSGRNSNNGAVVNQLAGAVQQPDKTVSKRNRKETHRIRTAIDEVEEVFLSQDTPPPSNASAALLNKSDDKLELKDETEEAKAAPLCRSNKVLLVDMVEDSRKPSSLHRRSEDGMMDADGNPVGKTAQLVKRLSREELERLVLEQMCLVIREKGATGVLERKLEAADALLERCKKRSESLQKQVTDLEQVVRRFVQQQKGRQPLIPPTKLTRSVGLQINVSAPSVTVLPVTNKITPNPQSNMPVKPSVSVVTTKTVTTSPAVQRAASIAIPPSFTATKSSDIASYVPKQAQPRYQTQRRSDEVILVTAGPISSTTKTDSYSTNKGTINISPVKQQQNNINTSGSNNARVKVMESPVGLPGPMARWAKVPISRASPNQQTTVVNKVTIPSRLPSVIDLTEEDIEKGRAAAAAAAVASNTNGGTATKQPTSVKSNQATFVNGHLSTAPPQRLVAIKSTSLNGRAPLTAARHSNTNNTKEQVKTPLTHPAPLPPAPIAAVNPAWKSLPSKPTLDIKRVSNGIVLSWNMTSSYHAEIASYQLFAYQEGSDPPTVNGSVWKRVGDVKALPLPMACTLTQFLEGHRYHFAVRAMDVHGRAGPYSEPGTILLS